MSEDEAAIQAAQAELKPLKKMMANIAAVAVPVSKIAPSDTIGRNRVILLVDPNCALLWYTKSSDGKTFLAALNDPNDTGTVKDILDQGYWRSFTIGNLLDEAETWGKKFDNDYNALVDKYNNALALLKQSSESASQEQAFIEKNECLHRRCAPQNVSPASAMHC